MGRSLLTGALAATVTTAGFLAWAARGRSSAVFGPSIYRGSPHRKAVALTFDDGPSPSTPRLLEVLARLDIPATFFVCGTHVRRLPAIARQTATAGHEIGNHTDTHRRLWLQSPAAIRDEIHRAQDSIFEATGVLPRLFRAPYGVRWFGLGQLQAELGLTGVMWTTLARDWTLDADGIAARLWAGRRNGAIYCLHDGRVLATDPDITSTIAAVAHAVPMLRDAGYTFHTVSALVR